MYLCTKRIPNAESINQRACEARHVARREPPMEIHMLIPVSPRLRADELDNHRSIMKSKSRISAG